MREKRKGGRITFIANKPPPTRPNAPLQQLRCHVTRRMKWQTVDFRHGNTPYTPPVWHGG
jgi:hypothetical protein